jgi:ribonuclease P protein component
VAQAARLRRRAEFQRVYRDGIKVVGRFVVLFFVRGDESLCRLGITVSRRIGKAVVRNRARRRIRELVRRDAEAIGNLCGDLVVNARRGVDQVAWPELEEDFTRCVGRVRRRVWGGE